MSAPTFGSIGTKLGASGSTPAFAVPAGVGAGDIIVVAFYAQTSTTTITAFPTGFTEAENSPRTVNAGGTGNHCLHVAWKRATGNDTGTYQFTLSAAVFVYGNAVRYTGCVASGNPWDSPTATADGGNSILTTAPAVSVTTAGPDRMLVYVATDESGDGGTWTQPAGMNQRQGGTNATNCEIADLVQTAAGSSGSLSATITAGGADRMGAWLGALIGTTTSGGVANADAALSVTAALTSAAASTKPLSATLAGVATATAAAVSTKPVDAALTATATVTPAASTTKPVDSALAVTATVTPAAAVTKPVDATRSTTATITAAASATKPVDATLTAMATITAAATIGVAPVTIDAAPTFTATVAAAGVTTKPAAPGVATTATITAAGATTKPTQATLAAAATITATATVTPAGPSIVPRPDTGTATRPNTGTVTRPNTGVVHRP